MSSANSSIAQNSTNEPTNLTRRDILKALAILPAAALPTLPTEQEAPKRKRRKPSCCDRVPSEHVVSGEWLKNLQADPERHNAPQIRVKLFKSNAYHTKDVSGEETWNTYEANCQVMIEQLLPLLHRNDLAALADLARAFYTQPPTAEEFAHIEEMTQREREALAARLGHKARKETPNREGAAKALAAMKAVIADMEAELG